MNKKILHRIGILIAFILIFTIGINKIYTNREIQFISSTLIFYDLFMPYLLGVILAFLGKYHFKMNKNKAIFMIILNILIFIFEILFMALSDMTIAIEVYVLISICLSFIVNTFLLELETKRK